MIKSVRILCGNEATEFLQNVTDNNTIILFMFIHPSSHVFLTLAPRQKSRIWILQFLVLDVFTILSDYLIYSLYL